MQKRGILFLLSGMMILLTSACINSNIRLFSDGTEPLQEFTLDGSGAERVMLIPANGVISLQTEGNVIRSHPGMVQETVSMLQIAERDPRIKAVVFVVNSPGGGVTASDILYREIQLFKKRTGIKVVVSMMDVAASGGYYISLPADVIYAHPTTVTGSVGVIFLRPQVESLLEKIGVSVNAETSGKFKDMGSPFRKPSAEEDQLFHALIMDMANLFYQRVKENRGGKMTPEQFEKVATARVFTAEEALKVNLIDRIGYLDEAISEAKKLAGLPPHARVVVYRRDKFNNDNPYNMETRLASGKPLLDTGVFGTIAGASAGFFYLWPGVLP